LTLGGGWLFLASVLLLVAVILRQAPLLLIAILLFFIYGAVQLWAKYALERVEYSRRLSTARAFFGEEVTLEISVANRKLLPLPWIHIEEELDEELTLLAGNTSASHKPKRVLLHNLLSLGWYHRVTRVYPIRCLRRGYFSFGPTRIQVGDFFQFRLREKEVGNPTYLAVYPRVVPLAELGIPSRDPFGELRLRRHLFQDPVRVVTTRDYAYGDPMKRIHWKATARVQRLQSKVFEHTTSMDLAIFLDVRTVRPPLWGEVTQLLETAVMATASIAKYASDEGYRVGLYVNQPYRNSDQMMRLPPSSHPDQLPHILEALAQVISPELVPIDRLVQGEGGGLPWASTLVVVTAVPTPALLATMTAFRRMGRPMALVLVGGERPEFSANGLPLYQVPAEVPWEKTESVQVNTRGGG
jgi:uncharacterized protein (DUF58 family)